MIDIDSSLQAIESHSSFWVRFKDPGNNTDEIAFEIKASPQRQRKILERSIKLSTNYQDQTDAGGMQISADWIGLAAVLSDDIIGWEGFMGDFNREKVKKWLSAYPSYAIAFAQSFKTILDEYEQTMVKRREAELKN